MRSQPLRYRIQMKGVLSEAWGSQFEGMRLSHAAGITILEGKVDQAALFAILSRIRDLGMPLLLVEQIKLNSEEKNYDSISI